MTTFLPSDFTTNTTQSIGKFEIDEKNTESYGSGKKGRTPLIYSLIVTVQLKAIRLWLGVTKYLVGPPTCMHGRDHPPKGVLAGIGQTNLHKIDELELDNHSFLT